MQKYFLLIGPITAFVVSVLLIPVMRRFALMQGIIDIPNQRSSHILPTPRIGGVGIVIACALGMLVSLYLSEVLPSRGEWSILLTSLAVSVVGFWDDVSKLSTKLRMVLYLVLSAVVWSSGVTLRIIDIPGIGALELNNIAGLFATVLLLAWYTNLFNFMDGIDGIAGGAAVVALGMLAYVFVLNDDILWALLTATIAAATVGFQVYNWPPAKIFMGDAGSIFLGFVCGLVTIRATQIGALKLSSALFMMLPFVFDSTFTLGRRIFRRERFWEAHRTHIYQQLCDIGYEHKKVTLYYTLVALLFAVVGLYLNRAPKHLQVLCWWSSLCGLFLLSIAIVLRHESMRSPNARPVVTENEELDGSSRSCSQ